MKSILITGATSGIGYQCALETARTAPAAQLLIACRNGHAGKEVIRKIKQETGHKNIVSLPLDLESLQSVRDFAAQFAAQPRNRIAALINNAGIQNIGATQYTKEGLESTFGTNHLAPLYLTLLLLPFMEPDASITFTASGVHDPKQKTGIEPPVFKTAKELAYPAETGEKPNIVGQRRYSTSKLCNILTVYELQEKLAGTHIRVNAFDPGMVPGTGLARTYTPLLRFVWKRIFPLLRYFVRNVNTAQASGRRLAHLAIGAGYKSARGKYFEGTKEIPSSADAYNKEYRQTLWASSMELLRIKQKETSLPLV